MERLRVNGWHLVRVIKLRRDFRRGWRQGLAVKDGKDEEEALAEGAKRVIAFRNTYRARAHQGVWTIKKPHRLVSSGVLVRACC